jgi:hypothetical protein
LRWGKHHRAGAVIRSFLALTCAGVVLMTAAMVLDPATLQAQSTEAPTLRLQRSAQQEFVNALCDLVGQCEQVLAVRPANAERGTEMVLWREDAADPDRINANELALVRHNPLFGTITVYAIAGERPETRKEGDQSPAPAWRGAVRAHSEQRLTDGAAERSSSGLASIVLSEADIASPGFIDRWRTMPSVQARVVGTGLADMRIESLEAVGQKRLSLLRLRLTWDDDSVDGTHESSAVVEAGRRRGGAHQQEYIP